MRLIRGLHNLAQFSAEFQSGSVVTIGNFDGVHLGHKTVLANLAKEAAKRGLPSVALIFEPFPIEFFRPTEAPVRLMNLREKVHALQGIGIDYLVCVAFNKRFAELSAQAFIHRVLVDALSVQHLVIGDDFRFGRQRQGDFALLKRYSESAKFSLQAMPTFHLLGERVSSTRIRNVLAQADLAMAATLMGHPFSFNGRVIHGKKLGRTIGFPTLNLNPKRLQMPISGVFAVSVLGLAQQPVFGVANIGVRPTVQGQRPSIEVHLFDWHKMVYGAHVIVQLEAFIRPEMTFNSLPALQMQITQDAEQAKQILTHLIIQS